MNWKYILIVFILAAVVGVGVLAYQYWWLPKEEAKILEVKAPEEVAPVVLYTDVILEKGIDRSPYPPVQRLIGIKNEGTKVVILENVNDVLPVSRYGQTKGRNKETDDLYVIPFIYSFAPEEQKIYIKRVEDGTEIYDHIYEYDFLSGKIRQLNLPSKYIFSYNHYHKISPDETRVAVYGRDGVGIFDLVKNEEITFIKGEDIAGILAHEAIVYPSENESLKLFQWKSPATLEYPVYQETEEQYVYQLKTIETIDLRFDDGKR